MSDSPWLFAAALALALAWLIRPLISHWLAGRCNHRWELVGDKYQHTSAEFNYGTKYESVEFRQSIRCTECGEMSWRKV